MLLEFVLAYLIVGFIVTLMILYRYELYATDVFEFLFLILIAFICVFVYPLVLIYAKLKKD